MKKRPRQLQVRRRLWAAEGEPKIEARIRGEWKPVASLHAARQLAEALGYPGGITVTFV